MPAGFRRLASRLLAFAVLLVAGWSMAPATAGAAVGYRASGSSCTTATFVWFPPTALTISKPSGAAVGDLMVLTMYMNVGAGWSWDSSAPTGWTLLDSTGNYGTYYRFVQSGDSSFTLAQAGFSAGTGGATISTFTGVDPNMPFADGNLATGTSATVTLPNATAYRAGSMRFSTVAVDAARSMTYSGLTESADCNGNSTGMSGGYVAQNAGATTALNATLSGSGNTAAFTYVINPVASAPTVTSISPSNGPAAGGTTVTINGTFLSGATSVKFGSTAATNVTVVNDNTITAKAPAGSGTQDVTVTTPSGTSATSAADQYTYLGVPTVTGLSPNSGSTAGGTSVTITGTNLTGATSVTFAGTSVSFSVVNATTITATAPAHAAGTGDVLVTTPGGTSANTASDNYTWIAPPTITSLSPSGGPIAGGTSVTITGTNFTGATSVTFGGTNATVYTVVNATTITATAPAHAAGTNDVVVTTGGGANANTSADDYTYYDVPTVTSLAPTSGPAAGGTSVTITGTNLSGATTVTIGGTSVGFSVVNATTITFTTPAKGAGSYDVIVTTPGGTSSSTSADDFTYFAAPTITSLSPSAGPTAGSTAVTVTGTNLTGATALTIGGTSVSYTVVNATTVTFTTPAHAAGAVDVRITTPGGTTANTSADDFTYFAAPTITSISPSTGPTAGGTSVTITGTNFTGATSVTFGGTAGTSLTVNSATSITITSPAKSAGTYDIVVTTPGGTNPNTAADDFTYASPPTVTAVSPTSGTTVGGTSVTITGTNLTGATAVSFGGTAASGYTVVNATTITATSPAHAPGTIDVRVTTPDGTSAISAADQFTYVPPCSTGGMSGSLADLSFPALTLDGLDRTQSASTTVTVSDMTGAAAGWKLGIGATQFTAGSGKLLPANAARIVSSSANPLGGSCVAPTAAFNSYPVTLPVSPSSTKIYAASAGTGTGPVDVTLNAELDVPATTRAGSYASTWTVDLSAGP